jgi:uncharacterized protein DUF6492
VHPEWWLGSAQVLGLPIDLGMPGMAITPALLSPVICRQLKYDLEQRDGRDWADVLLSQAGAHWTEYTLYYLTGERHGLLERLHTLRTQGNRTFFCSSNIWQKTTDNDFNLWDVARCFGDDDPGLFSVVQSSTGISARRVRHRLRPYLNVARPAMRQVLAREYWYWKLAIEASKWMTRKRQTP